MEPHTDRNDTCDHCGAEYDPTACRWLCPSCKQKNSCCEGSPLPWV